MPGRGPGHIRFAFIADKPTRGDVSSGFVWSDRKIVSLLQEAGMDESECSFMTLLKCQSDADPTAEQGSLCLGYLLAELAAVRPKVVYVSGRIAFQLLTKSEPSVTIGESRGRIFTVKLPWGDISVIPTWSPGYARHKISAAQDMVADIITGIAHLAPPRKKNYSWVNTPEDLIAAVDNILALYASGGLAYGCIAVDTETTNLMKKGVSPTAYNLKHNIGTIQVAWNPGFAFAVPVIRKDSNFNNPYNIVVLREQLKRLLDVVPVTGQNYKFDEVYFNVKLGVYTKHFYFDTMLGHHFLHGGSLPNKLDFLTPRYLGWVSHKHIIDAELDSMPDDDRRYSNLSKEVILEYGCSDADATLQLTPILIEKLRNSTYEKYEVEVIYKNMYEAFKARTMFPWRALKNIELRGAAIDAALLPEISKELEDRMQTAFGSIENTPVHALWLLDHTIPNPKRRIYEKVSVYHLKCVSCGQATRLGVIAGKKPKTMPCPKCTAETKLSRKMEPTERFTVVESEPETLVSPINLRSPKQVAEFFYSPRYLRFPDVPGLEGSTDKAARAYLLDQCEKAGMTLQASILLAIGDYNKASKLFSSYVDKMPNYLVIPTEEVRTTEDVTSRFELDTGVNHIHTNFYQDGTCSGRLSTRDPSSHVIPRKSAIKTMFVSRFKKSGIVLQNDLSQAEVRAFVIETDDGYLRDAFQRGLDPYVQMAAKTFSVDPGSVTEFQRQDNKSIVLGLLFGRGATAIAEQTKKSVSEVREIIKNFFGGMPKLKMWIGRRHEFVDKHRCAVSRFGRVRPLVDQIEADDDEMLNHAHNIGVNHPIQGMVGDLCVDSVARIEYRLEARGLRSVIFNTVHDSTILDVYLPELVEVMRIAKEEMFTNLPTYFPWINVPFAIDQELGLSWGASVRALIKDDSLVLVGGSKTVGEVFSHVSRILPFSSVTPEITMKGQDPVMKLEAKFR